MGRALLRWTAASVAIATAAFAFVAGRWSVEGAAPNGARPSEDVDLERRFETLDPTAPAWAPTAGWALPTLGSIYRNRLSAAISPLEGVEAVLVSPDVAECLDDCPLAVRQVTGEGAARLLECVFPSLAPDLLDLERAPEVPAAFAASLRMAAGALTDRMARRRATTGEPPRRALFIGMPRPDFGAGAASVGCAFSDLPDPHFDRKASAAAPRLGWRLLISRVERIGDGRSRPILLAGAIEVGQAPVGRPQRPIPPGSGKLGAAFGSIWGHFGTVPDAVVGLYLDPDGRVYAYDSDLRLRLLPESPALRRRMRAVLHRA